MTNMISLLQTATYEYDLGNLSLAKKYIFQLLHDYKDTLLTPKNPLAMPYFKALILAQSIATRTLDLVSYELYEAKAKEGYLNLFGDLGTSYYGLHLTDACETYLNADDAVKAQQLLLQGISILEEKNGFHPLLDLLYYFHTAKLHFRRQEFHQCIDAALNANNSWMNVYPISNDASPFLQQLASNALLVTQFGYSNGVVLACAYGKINNPEPGIAILKKLMTESINDFYLKYSIELSLAELYIHSGEYNNAKQIYEKYKSINVSAYPDLCVALSTLSLVLETPDSLHDYRTFIPEFCGQLSGSLCYSKDTLQILLYNRGLKMISDGQYSDALALYRRLENRGLSLQLYLLAKIGEYSSIPEIKPQADHYFEQEIRNLFSYYNETLVHNHLSLLETHFSFCMDSYIQCLKNLGSDAMPPKQIYDFFLNTKYISLEATYLSRHYQTLDALNNRKAFITSDIQNCLSQDTALLEYCLIKTLDVCYYCVFIITSNMVSCIPLSEESAMNELLSQWNNLIQTPIHTASYDSVMYEHNKSKADALLRRHLFRPLKSLLLNKNISHLIIAPAGDLIHFPFSCLPVSSTSYLGEEFEITYVNTGKELITNPPLPVSCIDSGLIVGNPDFLQFKPLPYAQKEAEMVAHTLNLPYYIGKQASLSLFEPCLESAPVLLHLATHGVFGQVAQQDSQENYNTAYEIMDTSGLVLTDDVLLSCNQIAVMDFSNTFLTVLSACQTGRGMFHCVEGVYGLRRAFRLAGAHSIIFSLWQVDDYSGCLFMQYFYKYLYIENHNAKKAFFQAISALKTHQEKGDFPFSHPYYWAGYLFME